MEDQNTAQKPLVDQNYLLQKIPGKGGWTFASIPQIAMDEHAHFGWVKVKGSIDSYEIDNYHLMPMGNGQLFLPVKAEIRKIIGKNEGDFVHIILYSKELPTIYPEDFLLCLKEEPVAHKNYLQLTENEKQQIIEWIYAVKRDDLKVERIVQSIDKLLKSNS
jgi:hypothetical protein